MDSLLKNLSKTALAAIAIGFGILVIVVFDPPHSICSAQKDQFVMQQTGNLIPDVKKKENVAKFETDYNRCKQTNAPGGCYELFSKMKVVIESIDSVDVKCLSELGGLSSVKTFFNNSINLLAQLAWGGRPPDNITIKYGWLDSADIGLFCKVKDRFILTYGNSVYQNTVEKAFLELPGVKDIPREQAWQLMIYSTNCTSYL